MSFQHRLQENRFELKYVINEACARAIRDFARSYLVSDEHADPELNYSYPIHSIYLDSADYTLCQATMRGLKNRFKLRIRYYDGKPESPVFFEIKRRVNDAILKRRAAVKRSSVLTLLDGHWPSPEDLVRPDDLRARDALQQFCDLRNILGAEGRVIVSYVREAWVTSENNSVRLTFDRELMGLPWRRELTCRENEDARRPPVGGTVLEIKFTDRFPGWMGNMVHVFNLQRCSMAKYVHCVTALREFRRPQPIEEVEAAL